MAASEHKRSDLGGKTQAALMAWSGSTQVGYKSVPRVKIIDGNSQTRKDLRDQPLIMKT